MLWFVKYGLAWFCMVWKCFVWSGLVGRGGGMLENDLECLRVLCKTQTSRKA